MWQDFVFLGGSIVIMLSLVPTLRDEDASVPLRTSLPSVVVLFAQTIAFATIGLTASAVGTGMGFVLWTLIAKRKSPVRERRPSPASSLRGVISILAR
ncbi:hypothetical protein [halophilic archaeon]|uniref:hypothetical protein n=1 Tax=Halomicrococcus sp. SG-WS-1 TaxID=3439057 RepID=UPI000DDC98BA|nr:hypothetical protein DMJ13_06545 [halophilic archaeon]